VQYEGLTELGGMGTGVDVTIQKLPLSLPLLCKNLCLYAPEGALRVGAREVNYEEKGSQISSSKKLLPFYNTLFLR